ncbi:MAG: SDR family oxidoreductase [Cyanobacteria bacterium P01_F01_bin.42]
MTDVRADSKIARAIAFHSMKKLLITGASGFLGWYLCQEATKQGWKVYGTAFSKLPDVPNVQLCQVDLTNLDVVRSLMKQIRPDAVIHAAAMGRPNECQDNPEQSYAINMNATESLAKLCDELSCKLVFISTEQVFDGLNPPYREVDSGSPINIYGEHKAIAEQKVLAISPDFLVCRMPLMFGAVPHAPSFLQGFLERLERGETLNLFVDEIRTPLFGGDAAQGILLGLEKARGILHLGGAESLSRYQFGQQLVAAMGLSESCLQASRQAEVKFSAPRPPDLSMDIEVARSLGYCPRTVSARLKQVLKEAWGRFSGIN